MHQANFSGPISNLSPTGYYASLTLDFFLSFINTKILLAYGTIMHIFPSTWTILQSDLTWIILGHFSALNSSVIERSFLKSLGKVAHTTSVTSCSNTELVKIISFIFMH